LTPLAQARQTEQARTQFECATTKVIMTNKAGQSGSVQVEEHMTFWIDDAAKTFIFSDGQLLRISRRSIDEYEQPTFRIVERAQLTWALLRSQSG
jgi:hypothetical protein